MLCIHNSIRCFTALSASHCDHGWSFSPHSKNCYFLMEEPIGWNVAEMNCQWKMAHIMSIHSANENQFVAELAAYLDKPIWIGAAQFGNSHMYEYSDFSNFDYANWVNGTQPEYNRGKKCIKMHPSNKTWFQDCCFKRPVPYFCQKPSGNLELPESKVSENTAPVSAILKMPTMRSEMIPLEKTIMNGSSDKIEEKQSVPLEKTKTPKSLKKMTIKPEISLKKTRMPEKMMTKSKIATAVRPQMKNLTVNEIFTKYNKMKKIAERMIMAKNLEPEIKRHNITRVLMKSGQTSGIVRNGEIKANEQRTTFEGHIVQLQKICAEITSTNNNPKKLSIDAISQIDCSSKTYKRLNSVNRRPHETFNRTNEVNNKLHKSNTTNLNSILYRRKLRKL
ncbi:Lymphocyte antigen 75 [Toxocara canis]|uniref:Lymphocyte antigen 75 n=1 Tax=Toxocara canis TaxID=6265 RepID=A0A0B2VAH2_TOXCA|nr:Lymphocyte antigen 75 [Toxocara canis]